MFSYEFWEISKSIFFAEHLRTTASEPVIGEKQWKKIGEEKFSYWRKPYVNEHKMKENPMQMNTKWKKTLCKWTQNERKPYVNEHKMKEKHLLRKLQIQLNHCLLLAQHEKQLERPLAH